MRVCQIISSFYPVMGGAEQSTLRLSQELTRQGAEVIVLTRRYPGFEREANIEGIRVRRLGIASRSKLGALTFILHALFVLATSLKDWRLVHAQGTDAQLIVGILAKRLLRRRVVLTVHSDPHLTLRIDRPGGGPRLKAVRDSVDVVGVLGPHMATTLTQEGVDPERIEMLPNGVDTERFRRPTDEERAELRRGLEVDEDAVVCVYVGRLIELKRVDLLMRAWTRSRLANEPLLIVGDGPEREKLEALAAELGNPAIRLLGRREVPEDILMAGDLFALPSQREGQSMALLEAMACGLVPVVSDLEPNQAVVEDGRTGFVFEVDDETALVEAFHRAHASNLNQVREAGVASVRSGNSLERTANTHLALYEHLVTGTR